MTWENPEGFGVSPPGLWLMQCDQEPGRNQLSGLLWVPYSGEIGFLLAPYACEVSKVIVLDRHSPLVPHKRQIPFLEIIEGTRLDRRGWKKSFH